MRVIRARVDVGDDGGRAAGGGRPCGGDVGIGKRILLGEKRVARGGQARAGLKRFKAETATATARLHGENLRTKTFDSHADSAPPTHRYSAELEKDAGHR